MEKIEEYKQDLSANEHYNRFKNLIINVMANQWTPLGSADKAFIAKYFNEIVIPQLPKGEPLLKCTSCSSAFWNAVKTSVNFINHNDKKLQAKVDLIENKNSCERTPGFDPEGYEPEYMVNIPVETINKIKDEQHNEGTITGGDIGKEINPKPTVNKKRSKK